MMKGSHLYGRKYSTLWPTTLDFSVEKSRSPAPPRGRRSFHDIAPTSTKRKNLPKGRCFSSLWTHGESNPDLFHAMEPFYRYTMGPSVCRILAKFQLSHYSFLHFYLTEYYLML